MNKLAFIVQRYGLEVNGGAELHCRWIAERLTRHFDVHVITTCALDYMTWANHYPPGVSELNGVTVHRFQVDKPRNVNKFKRLSQRIFGKPHNYLDELNWMTQQGPYSPGLLEHLQESRDEYGAHIFFTYLYFTTYFGIQILPERSLLVPTAHDEPPIYLSLFRPVFHLPRFIIYNTATEREFVEGLFNNGYVPNALVGTGIQVPGDVDDARFRSRYNIKGDFALYVGRIDESKNCGELFDYFVRYSEIHNRDLDLVLIGKPGMTIPEHARISPLGFVDEEDKFAAMRAASVVIIPSRYESLSMVNLEAWLMDTPVLVNGECNVLKDNCLHSNGGLWYQNHDEFAAALTLLLDDSELAAELAANGRGYAEENYSWNVVEAKYLDILRQFF